MIKQIFIDTETTGLDPQENGIIEIGGIVRVKSVETNFSFFGRPFSTDRITREALVVNRTTMETIGTYPSATEMYTNFKLFLESFIDKYNKQDKFFLYGWNVDFDDRFLRAFFKKNNDNYYGSYFIWPPTNVAALVNEHLKEKRFDISDFHLHTVAEYFKIPVDSEKRHSAWYDAKLTMMIYDHIRKKSNETNQT